MDVQDTRENREEFARRLAEARVRKGWRQADLARSARIGRDLVSNYEKAKSMPTGMNLQKLCRALQVDPSDLIPEGTVIRAASPEPALAFRETSDGRIWLRVNQAVDFDVGLQIIAMLRGKKVSALPNNE